MSKDDTETAGLYDGPEPATDVSLPDDAIDWPDEDEDEDEDEDKDDTVFPTDLDAPHDLAVERAAGLLRQHHYGGVAEFLEALWERYQTQTTD